MAVAPNRLGKGPTASRVQIDFLFLDLDTCTRCRGTDRSLEEALEIVRDLLAATGVEVEVRKIHVESAEQARALRFESSPTLRVNGRDVAVELRESSCGCDACTDGSGEGIACRVWVHDGREYTEPPVEMIVDAILREVYGGTMPHQLAAAEPYELPENLGRFFAGKRSAQSAADDGAGCCAPEQQRSCCEPGEKAACCGAGEEACGCQ